MTRIFLIAGETSGDELGAGLMRALRRADPGVAFAGVGGSEMMRAGLATLFPIQDIAVMGIAPVLARLPTLLARINATARAALDFSPHALVLIDAPDFTHRVARQVRRAAPAIPIVDYVCPTVWAWRPGRARKMRAYVDHVLALLPFEPAAMARLGGPSCDYVGHPLVERLGELTPSAAEQRARANGPLLVLPGSRLAEVRRMTPLYGETLRLLARERSLPEIVIPVAPGMEAALAQELRDWPMTPRLMTPTLIGAGERYAAFRSARAALATSGVATLELALAGAPMTVAYRASRLEALLAFLITVDSIVLPNLILGECAAPEFVQKRAAPALLARSLSALLSEASEGARQQAAYARLREIMTAAGQDPSARAAEIVLRKARSR